MKRHPYESRRPSKESYPRLTAPGKWYKWEALALHNKEPETSCRMIPYLIRLRSLNCSPWPSRCTAKAAYRCRTPLLYPSSPRNSVQRNS